MSRKSELACLLLAMLGFSGYHVILYATAPAPAIVSKNADGYIASIHGVDIHGIRYNVTFHYQATFDKIFGTGDPPTISEPTFYVDGAEAARAAISDVLTTQLVTNDGSAPNILYVPYRTAQSRNRLRGVGVHVTAADIGSNIWVYLNLKNEMSRTSALRTNDGWATFEPADQGANEVK